MMITLLLTVFLVFALWHVTAIPVALRAPTAGGVAFVIAWVAVFFGTMLFKTRG